MPTKDKIVLLDELAIKVEEFKAAGKTVVQSHGVFDIIHPGIIQHLNEAKGMGDVLVVTVIKDKDVRRGPGRPVFPDRMRVENVASLEQVDLACAVDDVIPFECVKRIKPDIFARGQAYKERDREIHQKIFEEEKDLFFGKSKILETRGFTFSSSQFLSDFLEIYPNETKQFIYEFAQKYTFHEILKRLHELEGLNVLVVGDGIIDEYHYCSPLGKSAKANLVVSKYLTHEVFAGGAFAIANHVAGICKNVTLVTLLGNEDSRVEFVVNSLRPNVRRQFFYRDDSTSIIKKRYVDQYLNQKLFEINYLNEDHVRGDCEDSIIAYLTANVAAYDLVLVSDFGHGLLTPRIIRFLQEYARFMAVNTQTNAANTGFNMVTKYRNPHFVCLDETEARLTLQNKFDDIGFVTKELFNTLGARCLIVTLGKKGSVGLSKEDGIHYTPIFSSKVIDTVGAGDAVFAFTAPCFARNLPLDLITFIGNAVGALAVQIVCNKRSIERYELFEFLNTLLKKNSSEAFPPRQRMI